MDHVSLVQLPGLWLAYADLDIYSSVSHGPDARSANPGVRISHSHHDSGDFGLYQRLSARGCSAFMRTWLQRYKERGAAGSGAGFGKCEDLGMGAPGLPVPT